MLEFSFVSNATYTASITALRTWVAAHRSGTLDINIMPYEAAEKTLVMRMNLQNLYLDGFRSEPGETWYKFEDAVTLPNAIALKFGGAHRDLMTFDAKTKINGETKFKIDQVINHSGDMEDKLRLALSFLVVAISEATRFAQIEAHVASALMGPSTYLPIQDKELMNNWSKPDKLPAGTVPAVAHS